MKIFLLYIQAYKPTSTAALAMLDLNPKLRGAWQVGQFNLGYPKDPHNTNDTSNTPVASGVRFVEFIHMPTNLSVISIRGTHAVEDVFQDMYLWSAVCFLQMSSAFGTMVGSWPTSTVAYVNYLITNYASYPNLLYYGMGGTRELVVLAPDIIHQLLRHLHS